MEMPISPMKRFCTDANASWSDAVDGTGDHASGEINAGLAYCSYITSLAGNTAQPLPEP